MECKQSVLTMLEVSYLKKEKGEGERKENGEREIKRRGRRVRGYIFVRNGLSMCV